MPLVFAYYGGKQRVKEKELLVSILQKSLKNCYKMSGEKRKEICSTITIIP